MNSPIAEAVETRSSNACPACSHPLDGHDNLGTRFCTATIDSHLDRGCICPSKIRTEKPAAKR
ncbi:RGCVC family protein [Saccharothrix sp. AJ9571]|nr:RGCVC family protein [Saccharothrix sp. AJ9571]